MEPVPPAGTGCRLIAEFEDDASNFATAEPEFVPILPPVKPQRPYSLPSPEAAPVGKAEDVEALYRDFLHWFYEKEDREKAAAVARRLEAVLAERPEVADSI